jgi:hypothetical protein
LIPVKRSVYFAEARKPYTGCGDFTLYSFVSGTGTATFSHVGGDVLEVGDQLMVTLSNLSNDGGSPPEITATTFMTTFLFGPA